MTQEINTVSPLTSARPKAGIPIPLFRPAEAQGDIATGFANNPGSQFHLRGLAQSRRDTPQRQKSLSKSETRNPKSEIQSPALFRPAETLGDTAAIAARPFAKQAWRSLSRTSTLRD